MVIGLNSEFRGTFLSDFDVNFSKKTFFDCRSLNSKPRSSRLELILIVQKKENELKKFNQQALPV